MSLDLYFFDASSRDERREERRDVHLNITHNCNKHAEALGIYQILWRSQEVAGGVTGRSLGKACALALIELLDNGDAYTQYDDPKGWGTTKDFTAFIGRVLQACAKYPNDKVVSDR